MHVVYLEMKSTAVETLNTLSDCSTFLSFRSLSLFVKYLFFCAIVPSHPALSLLYQSLKAKDSPPLSFSNLILGFFYSC